MSEKVHNYTVSILGRSYSLVSDKSENHVQKAVDMLNDIMQEVKEKSPLLDDRKLAILAALTVASNVIEAQKDLKHHNDTLQYIIEYIDQALV